MASQDSQVGDNVPHMGSNGKYGFRYPIFMCFRGIRHMAEDVHPLMFGMCECENI